MSSMVLVWGVLLWLLAGALLGGLLLWAGAQLLNLAEASFARCTAAGLVVAIIQLPFLVSDVLIDGGWPNHAGYAVLVALLVLPWFPVAWLLRTSLWRAGVIYLFLELSGTVAGLGLGLAWPVDYLLIERLRLPNGAMAPTLLGVHGDMVCTNCGLPITVGLTEWIGPDDKPRERQPLVTECPNCRQLNAVPTDTSIDSGDRILVPRFGTPRRWDLTVFRYPAKPSMIFVKRVVGLPGETVELCGGDVFIDGRRVARPPDGDESTWILVHDTAYQPQELQTIVPPQWQPASKATGWSEDEGAWSFTPSASVTSGEGLSPTALIFAGAVTDALAYNVHWPGIREPSANVGDVRITCRVAELSGPGGFQFRWQLGSLTATAAVKSSGEVQLTASGATASDADGTATGQLAAAPAAQRTIGFAVRDGRAYVLDNGHPVVSLEVGPQDIAAVKRLLATTPGPYRLSIVPLDCTLRLTEIVLDRDVYYCNLTELGGPPPSDAGQFGCTGHPLKLGNDEYFVLGDNSRRSADSRYWGVVKRSAVIGAARAVYWPRDRIQRLD